MKSPLAKALMTTSAKHIWTRTANRREPAKAIFFFNQIVFLIMFLFLPKLLIRHLEDFLLRGKCNKLVRFPRLPPTRGGARRPCLRRGVPGPAAGVPTSRVAGAASPLGAEPRKATPVARRGLHARTRAAGNAPGRGPPRRTEHNRRQRCRGIRPGGTRGPLVAPCLPRQSLSALRRAVSAPLMSLAIRCLPRTFPPVISSLSTGRGITTDSERGD